MILWCAFGVIVAADHLAELLGEPYGTPIVIFSIVAIVLIGSGAPTVGRDTMFAVMMIVLNGVIGLSLVVGGLKHHHAGVQPASSTPASTRSARPPRCPAS